MARETKIGIALMVLLLGVFGAMVYKKWNGRQPTAVAQAAVDPPPAESNSASDAADPAGEPTLAPAPTSVGEPTLAPEPVGGNPFATDAGVTPVAQSQTTDDPFADAGFAPSDAEASPPFDEGSMQPVPEALADQTEPPFTGGSPFAEAESPFGDPSPMPFAEANPMPQNGNPVAADEMAAEAESVFAADTASPAPVGEATAIDDPFAAAAGDASESMAAEPAPTAIDDDPFGEATPDEAAVIAQSEPIEATAPDDDPFAMSAEAPMTVAGEPEQMEPAAVAEDDPFGAPATIGGTIAEAEPADAAEIDAETAIEAETAMEAETAADDPFAEPSPVAANPAAVAGVPPGRIPDGTAIPVGGSDVAVEMEDEPFAPPANTSASAFSAEAPAGTGAGSPTNPVRHDHYVVEENDSYWSISKQVYGTPVYFHALAQFNASRVADPHRLRPGMKILTPPPQELSARFPKLMSSGTAAEREHVQSANNAGFFVDSDGQPFYRVAADDTLTGIAQTHLGRASRWMQIYEMNRTTVSDPKSLRPGTTLRLPADASRVRLVPEG